MSHKYWKTQEYDHIVDSIEETNSDSEDEDVNIDQLEINLFNKVDEPFAIEINSQAPDSDDDEDSIESSSDTDDDDSQFDEESVAAYPDNNFGLKSRCPFNELQAFHAIHSFPPDIMHDLFEGVVAQDLCGVLKILSSSGWFSLEEYSKAMKKHQVF